MELLELQRDSGGHGVTNITGILFVSRQIIGVAAADAPCRHFFHHPLCFTSLLLLAAPAAAAAATSPSLLLASAKHAKQVKENGKDV